MGSIIIVGGNGFIGQGLAIALRDAGHSVTTPARRTFDLATTPPEQIQPHLAGHDLIINCVGMIRDQPGQSLEDAHIAGVRHLLTAARQAGVPRLIHLSALGAGGEKSARYFRSKGEAEALIAAADGIEACILRPSLVIGRGGGSTDLFGALAALPIPLRIGPGNWQVQPLHLDDLCAAVVRLAADHTPWPARLDLVGPQPMSTDDLTAILRRWLGYAPRRPWGFPTAILTGAAPLIAAVTGQPLSRETLGMLADGNTGDPAPVTALLGRPPRQLEAALARHPATMADRWRAQLIFAAPLLRLSLAFLWIITALVSAGLYPVEKSYELVGLLGITGPLAPLAVYGGALIDLLLGLALLLRWRIVWIGAAQILMISGYTLLITGLPFTDYWLHPFAPILKNIPLLAATLVMMVLEQRK